MTYVSQSPNERGNAERTFRALVSGGRSLDEHLQRCFELQHACLLKDWEALSNDDLLDRARSERSYNTSYYRQLFERWRRGELETGVSPKESRTSVEFSTYASPTVDALPGVAS